MIFELPELKFEPQDLGEYMSEETVFFHYEKHHQAYADKANDAVKGTPYESIEDIDLIIKDTYKKEDAIFNNVAQFYNHNLFWELMDSSTDKTISPEFEAKMAERFGSFEDFKEEFCALAVSQFGSGWAWLVKEKDGSMDLYKTSNAKPPVVYDQKPILTCDVWEHAYYLDYKNNRAEFVKNFLDHLVNWKVVEERFNN